MDARRLAARMTGFRPVDHRDVVGGGTPGLGLTGIDVAGALAMGGATRGEALMVLRKWVLDTSVQEPLFYAVYDAVVTLAASQKWKIPKGAEFLRKLTRLAIAEEVDPKRCRTCNGRGTLYRRSTVIDCPVCAGTGTREMRPSERARATGIHRSNWPTWGPRYYQIRDVVAGFDRRGLDALMRGIGE